MSCVIDFLHIYDFSVFSSVISFDDRIDLTLVSRRRGEIDIHSI